MTSQAVPWRRVAVVVIVAVLALGGAFVAFRSDGFESIDAAVPRATRWFVYGATGQLVLADGFSGRALARLDSALEGATPEVAQSAAGVAILDRNAATAREVDVTSLRLGSPQPVGLVADPNTVVGIGQTGLVAVEPGAGDALLLPPGGDPLPFQVSSGSTSINTRIAPDGSVWSLADGTLGRWTTVSSERVVTGLSADASFALVGNVPLVFDAGSTGAGRVSFAGGTWVDLPRDLPLSEVVLQQDSPAASCGWLAADDRMWCVGDAGLVHDIVISDLDVSGSDLLAVAGDAAALVRRSTSTIVRLDWRAGEVIDAPGAPQVPPGAQLQVTASSDLIWVDDRNGEWVWAINPWGVQPIRKDDETVPLLGDSGEVIEPGQSAPGAGAILGDADETAQNRTPDNNGIDDPPVAIDDPATARTGGQVQIEVTANDYDPDGEAIVVVDVDRPRNGVAEITSASTVTYRPATGYVGVDEFDYTIADGNGTEASATVTIELLSPEAPNREPIGRADVSETGPGVPVVVDVLLNDIDPERDALRIDSFTEPDLGGSVVEVPGPSGLPGLRYEPPPGVAGTATFTYRPVDSLGAVGESVTVEVEIAQITDENRPPIVQPDAILVRRDRVKRLPVLANDRDPDGDRLLLSLPDQLPPGIDARVDGNEVVIIARAGAADLNPFSYFVDDGHGNVVAGSVLVALIDDDAPNAAPVANPDAASVVVGTSKLLDVLANDTDPDGDTPVLVSVRREGEGGGVRIRGDRVEYVAAEIDADDEQGLDRFEYTITDGKGGEDTGEVTVRVLPERIAEPPYAQDDAATTTMNVAVTLDVLRNDGDPSGEEPTLVGDPGCPQGGTAVVTPDSRVTFTPPTDRIGLFTCTYEVTNSVGGFADATITINVVPPEDTNQDPLVRGELLTVLVGETGTVDLLANDTDPDGDDDDLRVVSIDRPNQGTLRREGGTVVYDAGTVPGVISVTYQVADPDGGLASGDLRIEIVPADPEPPSAAPDRRTVTAPVGSVSIDVLANDIDPDGDESELRITSTRRQSGEASFDASTNPITITPDPEFVGDIVLIYTVTDSDGLSDRAQVVLTVIEAPNRPPVAGDDAGEVVTGGTIRIPLALNDSDPDGDSLAYRIVSAPDAGLGTASLDGAQMVFSSTPGASGEARITYEISDGQATARAVVRVRILACSQGAPVAPDLMYTTGYMQPITIDLTTEVSNGEVVEVGPPLSAPAGTYTPPAGENGNITFGYVVQNGCRVRASGTVTIDVNQQPVGQDYSTRIGRREVATVPVNVLASDAEPLSIDRVDGAPTWATVTPNGDGIRLDPSGDAGRFNFIAVVVDPGGLQARVAVTVDVVNLAPVANADEVRSIDGGPVTFRPLDNDTDPDNDQVLLNVVPSSFTFGNGAVGTIVRQPNGALLIDPQGGSGQGSFTYTIVDDLGLTSGPATVTVIVNGGPSAPGPIEVMIPAGQSRAVTVAASDPDGDPLTLTIIGDPSPLSVAVDGFSVVISVPVGAGGRQYQVAYRVTDPLGAFDDGVIVVAALPPPTTTTTSTTTTTTTVPPTTVPPTTVPVTPPPDREPG